MISNPRTRHYIMFTHHHVSSSSWVLHIGTFDGHNLIMLCVYRYAESLPTRSMRLVGVTVGSIDDGDDVMVANRVGDCTAEAWRFQYLSRLLFSSLYYAKRG